MRETNPVHAANFCILSLKMRILRLEIHILNLKMHILRLRMNFPPAWTGLSTRASRSIPRSRRKFPCGQAWHKSRTFVPYLQNQAAPASALSEKCINSRRQNQFKKHQHMKKVIVITSSLRPGSNSDALAEAFAQGAAEAGHNVETISLKGKDLRFCKGCLACQKTRKCAIADDAPAIVQKMHGADAIAFATPIYYYELSGQLKTLLDRANPLFGSDYRFRDIYLLTSAADEEARTPERAINGLGDRMLRESPPGRHGVRRRRQRSRGNRRPPRAEGSLRDGEKHLMVIHAAPRQGKSTISIPCQR